MCQGGRKSSHLKGILHDREVVRREKVEKRNQEITGKCEEGLREEEMHRTEDAHKRGQETFHYRKVEKACNRD